MNLLARFGLCGLDRLSLLTCRRSIGLRSLHLVPSSGNMETPINPREPSGSPPAATAAVDPRWEMLSLYGHPSDSVADSRTMAECQTSTGQQLRVSFGLAVPPASSFLYYDLAAAASTPDDEYTEEGPTIMAAHGDSVLLEIRCSHRWYRSTFDYFVYRAAGAARAPSLSLLPACDYHEKFHTEAQTRRRPSPREQLLLKETTGVLRRRDDELLVVSLEVRGENRTPRDTAGQIIFSAREELHPLTPPSDFVLRFGIFLLTWILMPCEVQLIPAKRADMAPDSAARILLQARHL
ncbi:hypothetical protein ACP70R_004018 [Stipagrostis hirtigluma subsp. patula]